MVLYPMNDSMHVRMLTCIYVYAYIYDHAYM